MKSDQLIQRLHDKAKLPENTGRKLPHFHESKVSSLRWPFSNARLNATQRLAIGSPIIGSVVLFSRMFCSIGTKFDRSYRRRSALPDWHKWKIFWKELDKLYSVFPKGSGDAFNVVNQRGAIFLCCVSCRN
jgi:hypothetical protein